MRNAVVVEHGSRCIIERARVRVSRCENGRVPQTGVGRGRVRVGPGIVTVHPRHSCPALDRDLLWNEREVLYEDDDCSNSW